ncbi:MAG TPA: helix-turn-helix domain-containing protein [Opitutaceae bacterium]
MPRTEEQFERMREASRAKILHAALHVFARRGFHSTTMAAIAKRAGVATGLLYNYFKSKDDLLAEILEQSKAELSALIKQHLSTAGKGDLGGFMSALLPDLKKRLPTSRLVLSIALQPETKHISKGTPRAFETLLMKAAPHGVVTKSGETWSAHETAEVLHAIIMAQCVTENDALVQRLVALLPKGRVRND